MLDQPRNHPRFLILLAAVALGTAPLPFIGGELNLFAGLPLWLLWSLGFTVTLSAVTSWGILRYWRDDTSDAGDEGLEGER